MNVLASMPASGIIVIAAIAILFVLAVLLLFYTWGRYKGLAGMVKGGFDRDNGFCASPNDFADAYKKYGQDVNTPAIISNAVSTKLSGLLLCERFLANAVSLFVTLGLFGTFLGLSHSVSSLTELISYSNTSEWLSVLDSVGGGLMSALSGMGVAFYTSLVGVACSIVLTLLRSIFSPQAERETFEARLELWLDHTVAPTLPTERAKDESEMVQQMVHAMDSASQTMERALQNATGDLKTAIDSSRAPIVAFNKTVDSFNGGCATSPNSTTTCAARSSASTSRCATLSPVCARSRASSRKAGNNETRELTHRKAFGGLRRRTGLLADLRRHDEHGRAYPLFPDAHLVYPEPHHRQRPAEYSGGACGYAHSGQRGAGAA